jgi:hypothetical protein
MKPLTLSAGLVALAFITAAHAEDTISPDVAYWRGFYIGGNVGGAWNST